MQTCRLSRYVILCRGIILLLYLCLTNGRGRIYGDVKDLGAVLRAFLHYLLKLWLIVL